MFSLTCYEDNSGSISYFEFVDKLYEMGGARLCVEVSELVRFMHEIRERVAEAKDMVTHHHGVLPKQSQLFTGIENKLDKLLAAGKPHSDSTLPESDVSNLPPLVLHTTDASPVSMLKVTTEKDLNDQFIHVQQKMKDLSMERESLTQWIDQQSDVVAHISRLLSPVHNAALSDNEVDRVLGEVNKLRSVLLELPFVFQNLRHGVDHEAAVLRAERETLDKLSSLRNSSGAI